ncbi:T9SS type A sorting domain-containing protein [Polaribacter pectinis]|uniref:T9SS type A sorting domain-containing protein n=1 Tax=Polaribacter pectinis TaxID=2738844 RepID=A0A7G9L9N2_9FLAO|nr:T9SS type A sorting domain-containing protein [Polaribacter pectinis]QNM85331.1 T9SS type A sorting domain-containing protein [Polaribacter pectinis]
MKTKLLFSLLFFCSFFLKAQIENTQTWEVFYPGVKLTYHINACANNEAEPTTDEYFWCDGPDRVTTESFGLTHGNVISSHEFAYNNEDYVVFATQKGISIYNKTQKKWRNISFLIFGQDNVSAFFYGAIDDGNGNIIFHGASKGTQKYSLTDNTITQINNQNYAFEQFKKNENTGNFKNSIWAVSLGGSNLMKYHNGIYKVYNNQVLGIGSSRIIKGIDISADNKIYLAVENEGVVVFDPATETATKITEADGLPSNLLLDLDFDVDGNLWITYRIASKGGVSKWDIANNTFENFEHTVGNETLQFGRVEAIGNQIWLSLKYAIAENLYGVYTLTFDNNNAPIWKHHNEAFFQEQGFVEHFYGYGSGFGDRYGINDLASYGEKLYITMAGNGTVVYQNNNWQHFSAQKNNIPSGNERKIGYIKQDKTGGIVFNTYTNNTSTKDIVVVSKLKNNVIENYPLGRGVTNVVGFEEKGQIDEKGNIYGRYITGYNVSNTNTFSVLNYPVFSNLLEDYSFNSEDEFAVEGFNKWYYDKNGKRLTNLDTNVSYNANNSNFDFGTGNLDFLTESPDERVWAISPSEGIIWYDPITDTKGVLTLTDLTNSTHSEISHIQQLLFGTGTNELWLIGRNGVVYLKNGVETHKFLKADYPTLNIIKDAKLDANNNLYVLNSFGFLKISDVQNATPTTKEFDSNALIQGGIAEGPLFTNFNKITIDNEGNKWFASLNSALPKLLKFKEVNDAAGIVNAATASNLRGKVSGKIFVDVNDNGTFEEATDQVIVNQSLNIKNASSSFIVYTDTQGNYSFPIHIANQTYEIAITSTDGFSYASDRVYKVDVVNLDSDYSNNNIPLKNEEIKSLYVKGSAKEGAWGFIRDGFENKFVSAIGNLSNAKTFNDVKVRYKFINLNSSATNYNNNAIESITIHRLKNNQNTHIIDKINIDPSRSQNWKVNLGSNNYTLSTDNNPTFTETDIDKTKTLEIEIGTIDPFEAIVLEIKTTVFDPTAIRDIIQYGPTDVSSSNWEAATSGRNNNDTDNWIDTTPESEDSKSGRDEDFSPYEEPEDIYEDEDDIYRDPKEIYSDGPYYTPVFSSYDPNDKLVTPGVPDKLNEVDIDKKWLTYTVRFQNNGNFSAKDVYVLDTIHNDFDRNSFKILDSSHDIKVSEVGSEAKSIKKFFFENIFLPDSLSNPEGSQGYLKYKIKAKETIPENTIVDNIAYIYFDQNPAIITNTIQNKFRTPAVASVKEFAIREEFSLFPNPAKATVSVKMLKNKPINGVQVYNMLGKRVLLKNGNNQSKMTINTSKLSSGIYLIKIKSENKITSKKLIIK